MMFLGSFMFFSSTRAVFAPRGVLLFIPYLNLLCRIRAVHLISMFFGAAPRMSTRGSSGSFLFRFLIAGLRRKPTTLLPDLRRQERAPHRGFLPCLS
jgi:hypothetical protein